MGMQIESDSLVNSNGGNQKHPVKRVSCHYWPYLGELCQRPTVISIRTQVIVFLIFTLSFQHLVEAGDISCQGIRKEFIRKGLAISDIPRSSQQDIHLKICPRGDTCCNPNMETKLLTLSRESFSQSLVASTDHILNTFNSKSRKFNEFFTNLLGDAKQDLHFMFKQTYGIIYERNSDVFTDFFKDLELYYENGNLDLEEALRKFFSHLYQRMFTVLNAQYQFDSKYLACVTQNMQNLQPFGDVPKKLTLSLRRSFVATRTFAQALLEGKKILGKIVKIAPRDKCTEALTKMNSCPHCQGLPTVRPCASYCHNVMRGCLAYHAELSESWDKFAESLVLVGERLIGPFNIADVVLPIDLKISDAIMAFQESGYEVTQKVFEDCGTPKEPRLGKRQAGYNYGDISYQTRKSSERSMAPKPDSRTSLDNLVNDIMTKIKDTKGFWKRLPSILCQNPEVGYGNLELENKCWNGRTRGIYTEHQVLGNGLAAQANNPEVEVDQDQDQDINKQIFALKVLTKKLDNAYNGQVVDWPDYSPGYPNDSGFYGSGDCYDDEDCYDSEESGSGESNSGDDDEYFGSGDDDYSYDNSESDAKPDWPPWLGGTTTMSDIGIEEDVVTRKPEVTLTAGSDTMMKPSSILFALTFLLYYIKFTM